MLGTRNPISQNRKCGNQRGALATGLALNLKLLKNAFLAMACRQRETVAGFTSSHFPMRWQNYISQSSLRRLKIALCLFMLACVGFFVFRTWHWPLVNDAPQISYLCFLMEHGMAPYRDIIEMNMPGTYLMHLTVMHTLGRGALAWRVFDLTILAAISAAMIAIARPYSRLAGIYAAALFVLFHGRDGEGQLGERDLVIAALLMVGYAFVFHALRSHRAWPMVVFGFCAGYAATIKPIPLPFTLLLLLAVVLTFRKRQKPWLPALLYGIAGYLVSFAIVAAFLVREHALEAFLSDERTMLPFYSKLGGYGAHWMLENSTTSSISALAVLVFALMLAMRSWRTWEERALLAGIGFGIFSYFIQQKGIPYHRYPMLAFLILFGGIQFAKALRERGTLRAMGVVGLAFMAVLAALYALTAERRPWSQQVEGALTSDLNALGGQQLSGHVQCLQTSAECDTVLYRMGLVQATGLSYDYFIFAPQGGAAEEKSRAHFWQQLQSNPPEVIVVGVGLYPRPVTGYAKLASWPLFSDYLTSGYRLYDDRSFPTFESRPLAYRIYVRKAGATLSQSASNK